MMATLKVFRARGAWLATGGAVNPCDARLRYAVLPAAFIGLALIAAPIAQAETGKSAPEPQSRPPLVERSPSTGSKPLPSKPQSAMPESSKPDGSQPNASKPEASKPDRTALPKPSSLKSAAQKTKVLADLHERLVAAENTESAEVVADTIEQMWLYSGSDTTSLLMERALEALHDKKPELALKLLDGVVALVDFLKDFERRHG